MTTTVLENVTLVAEDIETNRTIISQTVSIATPRVMRHSKTLGLISVGNFSKCKMTQVKLST